MVRSDQAACELPVKKEITGALNLGGEHFIQEDFFFFYREYHGLSVFLSLTSLNPFHFTCEMEM